jgi:hypothetical protein
VLVSFIDDAIAASRTKARLAGCTCTPTIEARELADGAYVSATHAAGCAISRRVQARSN